MSSANPTSSPLPPGNPRVIEYDDYIDQQIDKTRSQLQLTDLAAGLLATLLIPVGGLFALVLIDHWIVGLSVSARFIALAALLLASVTAFVQAVWPTIWRGINPVYAAQTVERSFPELKSSLLNLLLLRNQPKSIRSGVMQGMKRQTATKLSQVEIDVAVDRTSIIRLGYILVGLAAVWVAYILISPKDPLQTVGRVVLPWRDIDRPSIVQIVQVTPGDAEVFRGQTLTVETEIEGPLGDQVPTLEFSTLDGQLMNQRIDLTSAGTGRWTGRLGLPTSPSLKTTTPATLTDFARAGATESSLEGLKQDVEYRVIAGDATSRTFRVRVNEAPHIAVTQVRYDFPAYTGLPTEMRENRGDLRALEGTRITLFAEANQSLKWGRIEFLPHLGEDGQPLGDIKTAPLKITDLGPDTDSDRSDTEGSDVVSSQAIDRSDSAGRRMAEARFTLRYDESQKRSLYRAYRLRFANSQDDTNEHPVEHMIEVTRDLAPTVQIVTPEKRTTELPENGALQIDVRARDPDFELARVQLAARTESRRLFRKDLLSSPDREQNHSGPLASQFTFSPQDWGLKAGDFVECIAVAEDNRHAAMPYEPQPNISRSTRKFFRIVAPDPWLDRSENGTEEPGDQQGQQDQQGQPDGESGDATDASQKGPSENGSPPGQSAADGAPPDSAGNQPEPADNGQGEQPGDSAAQNENGSSQPDSGDESSPESSGDQSDSGGLQQSGKQGQDAGQENMQSGEQGPSGDDSPENSGTGDSAGDRSADQPSQGDSPGTKRPDEQSGDSGDQAGEEQGGENQAGESQDAGARNPSSQPNDSAAKENSQSDQRGATPDEPLPSDGSRDGDVVQRIKDYLDQTQGDDSSGPDQSANKAESPNDSPSPPSSPNDPDAAPPAGENAAQDASSGDGSEQPRASESGGRDASQGDASQGDGGERDGGQSDEGQRDGGERDGGQSDTSQDEKRTDEKRVSESGSPQKNGADEKPGQNESQENSAAQETSAQERQGEASDSGSPKNDATSDDATGDADQPNLKNRDNSTGDPNPDKSRGGPDRDQPASSADSADNDQQSGSGNAAAKPSTDGSNSGESPGETPSDDSPDDASPSDASDRSESDSSASGDRTGDQAGDSPGNAENGQDADPAQQPGMQPRDEKPGPEPESDSDSGATGETDARPSDRSAATDSSERSGNESGQPSPSGNPPSGGRNEGLGQGDATADDLGDSTGDDANLEYARQATDMVLDYLRDQRQNPDRELLDKLGWQPDDVKQFLQRWDQMKQKSETRPDGNGGDRLEQTLRSMGLRPPGESIRRGGQPNDALRGNRETGSRVTPPADIADRYRSFLRRLQQDN